MTDTPTRVEDFFARHGGSSVAETREGECCEGGRRGWSEVDAADGFKLRCDSSRIDDVEQLTWSEIAPASDKEG